MDAKSFDEMNERRVKKGMHALTMEEADNRIRGNPLTGTPGFDAVRALAGDPLPTNEDLALDPSGKTTPARDKGAIAIEGDQGDDPIPTLAIVDDGDQGDDDDDDDDPTPATGDDDDQGEGDEVSSKMTVEELRAHASVHEINLHGATTKADILKAIRKAKVS